MTKSVKRFAKIMIVGALMPQLLLTTPTHCAENSPSASKDSVAISAAQLDSLILALDTYETDIRLARVSIAEYQAKARLDSLLFEDYRAANKRTLFDRIMGEPIIWFVLGVWLGAQAIVYAGDAN